MDPSLQLHDKVSNYSVQRWIVQVMKALKHIRPLLRQVAITDIEFLNFCHVLDSA